MTPDALALAYVPPEQFQRLAALDADPLTTTALFADLCRINTLYMIMRAGSGHIGTSFSCIDVVSWIYLHEIGVRDGAAADDAPLYFSSKGHDAPALYAVLTACGLLDFDRIHTLRRLGGLPGHPDVGTPAVIANTGSLGMGISKAKGMIEAHRLDGSARRIFVLTGDGELQEGQIWESLAGAANRGLSELTVIVDRNKIQSDTWVSDVSDLGDLAQKFAAFGWAVEQSDGHDVAAVERALGRLGADGRPGVLIADTIKGRGVSFMEGIPAGENMYRFHSGAPAPDVYTRALDELVARCRSALDALDTAELQLERVELPPRVAPTGHRLVTAYGSALCNEAATNPRIVALDGDLVLDTGLIPFAAQYPDRFIECGIAEQDMVSQAGGLALRGKLPIVHSFACFLSPRATEQVYTNATEHTKIVYVGSLAGLVPGGPGHSHQSVRDVSLFGGVPGMTVVEPCHEDEVAPLLDVCLNELPDSVYMRLVTVPVPVPFSMPSDYRPHAGRGVAVREGADAVLIGAGPVVLSQGYDAAERLEAEHGLRLRVVNLPWLNRFDLDWLTEETADGRPVITVENHYVDGGFGERLLARLALLGCTNPALQLGVREVPVCGTNDEVLHHHRLDAAGIAEDVRTFLNALG